MDILQDVKTAVTIYLNIAYYGKTPEKQTKLLDTLNQFTRSEQFWKWDFLEREGDRTSLRLGNSYYPHMKLIIRGTAKSELLFYVDAHDSHFSLPPQFEEQLYKIRHKNMEIKQKIEAELKENNLTIMGIGDFHAVHFEPLPVPITVLAIDDEKHILNLMRIFLTKIGVRAITCSSVDDAIMHVQVQTPPDLILCDIMMPEKSGYEFYDWIKELGIAIPFYFVTGLSKGSIRYPEVPVIHKPFKVCDLNAPVQKIIQEKS